MLRAHLSLNVGKKTYHPESWQRPFCPAPLDRLLNTVHVYALMNVPALVGALNPPILVHQCLLHTKGKQAIKRSRRHRPANNIHISPSLGPKESCEKESDLMSTVFGVTPPPPLSSTCIEGLLAQIGGRSEVMKYSSKWWPASTQSHTMNIEHSARASRRCCDYFSRCGRKLGRNYGGRIWRDCLFEWLSQ